MRGPYPIERNHPVTSSNADRSRKLRDRVPHAAAPLAPPSSIVQFGTVPIGDCMLLN